MARAEQQGDRRVKLLALTDTGRDLRSALEAAMLEASPDMTGLDADERAVLRGLLLKASTHEGSGDGRAPTTPSR